MRPARPFYERVPAILPTAKAALDVEVDVAAKMIDALASLGYRVN